MTNKTNKVSMIQDYIPLTYQPSHVQKTFTIEEKINRIQLYRTSGIGPATYHTLMAKYHNAAEAIKEITRKKQNNQSFSIYSKQEVEEEFRLHEKIRANMLVVGEKGYPLALQMSFNPPPVISFTGDLSICNKPTISIVGARNASLDGKKIAHSLAHDLGNAGYVIVSGLARGIDTFAHRGSLGTGTIAIVAGGINKIYPPENQELYHEIVQSGLIISKDKIGIEPQATLFPERNQIIAQLGESAIIIESALKSGSAITAQYVVDNNKEIFVVPGSINDVRYSYSNELLKNGAVLITNAQDVINVLRGFNSGSKKMALNEFTQNNVGQYEQNLTNFPNANEGINHQKLYDGDEDMSQEKLDNSDEDINFQKLHHDDEYIKPQNLRQEILGHLGKQPIAIDEVIRNCKSNASNVLAEILELELQGTILRHIGNKIST